MSLKALVLALCVAAAAGAVTCYSARVDTYSGDDCEYSDSDDVTVVGAFISDVLCSLIDLLSRTIV